MAHFLYVGGVRLLMPFCVIRQKGQPGLESGKDGTVHSFSKDPNGGTCVNTQQVTALPESGQETYNWNRVIAVKT